MSVIQATVNTVIASYNVTLPELQKISYDVAFDYQDEAFGLGAKISHKQQQQ